MDCFQAGIWPFIEPASRHVGILTFDLQLPTTGGRAHASTRVNSAEPTPWRRAFGATRMSQRAARSCRPSSIVSRGVSNATVAPPTIPVGKRAVKSAHLDRS